VINFMFFVAEEARKLMARLGFRSIDQMVGQSHKLRAKTTDHWKARHLDFGDVLTPPKAPEGIGTRKLVEQDHGVDRSLDVELIEKALPALERGEKVEFEQPIRNVHRTAGAQLAGEVARRHPNGLPEGTIRVRFRGTAGQSFGAFMTDGMEFHLEGEANDYVGKGMTGGVLSVRTPAGSPYVAHQNVLIGNVVLYGATGGTAFFNGVAGERFCVRNSGAVTVVEGVGDHGCEYMTGGVVVNIGKFGRNFGAGMSGGFAYVLDDEGIFPAHCNHEMVSLVPPELEDLVTVQRLLERHHALTGSQRASEILAHWNERKSSFVKVYPNEYRRVVEERARRAKTETRADASAARQ
jgi:glutamate synthase (NADPH/NADH) large chain/glutamate synthase (ferredoxin)